VIQASLDQLEGAGLVRLATVEPDLEYLFRHALVQDATYGTLLRADRHRLHHAVGLTLEALYPDRRADLAPVLAAHFLEAGDHARALLYLTLAGKAALDGYANREATRFYQAALTLATESREKADLLAALAEGLARLGEYRDASAGWLDAATLYAGEGDSDGVARMYVGATRTAWEAGEAPTSLALAQEGLARLTAAPPSPGLADLLHEAARALHFNGLSSQAEPFCRQALALAQQLGQTATEADSWTTLALLSTTPDDERKGYLEKAVTLAEGASLLATAARAHNNLGSLSERLFGDPIQAARHYRRAADLARHRGTLNQQLLFLNNIISTALWIGDLIESELVLGETRTLMHQMQPGGLSIRRIGINEAALLRYRGMLDEARARWQIQLQAAQDAGDLGNTGSISTYLGELALELGDFAEAEKLLHAAVAVGDRRLGPGPVMPRCLLAAVQAAQGDFAAAEVTLDAARQAAGPQPGFYVAGTLALAEARVASAAGPPEAAGPAWVAALAALEAAEMRWYATAARMEWAMVLCATGNPTHCAAAVSVLDRVIAEFTAMGAPYYADQARARRAILEPVS
jgi:tetratricopeptide (TPR) repeat protein